MCSHILQIQNWSEKNPCYFLRISQDKWNHVGSPKSFFTCAGAFVTYQLQAPISSRWMPSPNVSPSHSGRTCPGRAPDGLSHLNKILLGSPCIWNTNVSSKMAWETMVILFLLFFDWQAPWSLLLLTVLGIVWFMTAPAGWLRTHRQLGGRKERKS
jgi:hypothetical protein